MKKSVLFAILVSLFSAGVFAQTAPKRQGAGEMIDIDNVYGDVAQIYAVNCTLEEVDGVLKKEPTSISQVCLFNERGDVVQWGPTMLDGLMMHYDYNAKGQMTQARMMWGYDNSVFRRTKFVYTDNGLLKAQIYYEDDSEKPSGSDFYKYNSEGQLIEHYHCNQNGDVTSRTFYEYDVNGRKVKEIMTDSDMQATAVLHYEYDAEGRLVKEDKADYYDIELAVYTYGYKYDSKGRKIEEFQYNVNDPTSQYPSTFYKYNDAGQLVEKRDYISKEVYTYDSIGNVVEKSKYADGEQMPWLITEYEITYRE